MAVHTMFTIDGLASLEPVGGLGEQDAGAAADQQENEQEAIGECARTSPCRVNLCAGGESA